MTMFLYDKFFGDYDKTIGQILLNAEDIEQEEKKENLIHTFDSLLEMNIIPVVNENDSVSYTEIESVERLFGDNDMKSTSRSSPSSPAGRNRNLFPSRSGNILP